jgi:NAD(P)-dependent dehydrogenase (short-subunit alcohol dehydrogenase family)
MKPLPDMTGKVALVTGAGGGLGAATALLFARAGADVAIADRKADGLANTAAVIAATGRPALVLPCDLGDASQCAPLVSATVERFGRLDALCNIAGLFRLAKSAEMPISAWNQVLSVNLTAPFLLSQAAIPHLLESHGAIVNVTSLAAHIGEGYAAAYCASKGGLAQLTKALAMEYIKSPVRINAISPGGMATAMGADFVPPQGADVALLARLHPLRGLVELDDMAAMIVFLASPDAAGFHGAILNMDQGMTTG